MTVRVLTSPYDTRWWWWWCVCVCVCVSDDNAPFDGIMMRLTTQSLLVVLIDVLIYVFHASFNEGWKCDVLFATVANSRTFSQSTESPILFRSCGHETQFSDQNGASKIGDSVLCFQPSVEMGRENVDKNIDKHNKQWFKGHETDNDSHLDAWKRPNDCFCSYRLFLSMFLIPLSTEGWKCDFFVRHNALLTITACDACPYQTP